MNRIATGVLLGCIAIGIGPSLPAKEAGANSRKVPAVNSMPRSKSGKLFVQPAAGQIEFHNDCTYLLRVQVAGQKSFQLSPGDRKLVPIPPQRTPLQLYALGKAGKWNCFYSCNDVALAGKWKMEIPAEFKDDK